MVKIHLTLKWGDSHPDQHRVEYFTHAQLRDMRCAPLMISDAIRKMMQDQCDELTIKVVRCS